MALLAEGDLDRAIVEFRNVLSLNEFHRDARKEFARALKIQGNSTVAYAQFLRIAEENPSDMEARLNLAQMAISVQNWPEAERHSTALLEASADIEGADAVDAVMRYRQATLDDDEAALREIRKEIEALTEVYPNDTNLLRVLIEAQSIARELGPLVETIDRAIAAEPDNITFYRMKATALNEMEDFIALEEHLRVMLERFPDAEGVSASIIRLLAASGQLERAEDFLRDEIARSNNPQEVHVGLVAFLRQVRGDDAALAEIDSAIATYESAAVLQALRAGILFDQGDRESAITEMEAAIESGGESPQSDQLKVGLAKMLLANGNEVGARTLVEEVLESDATQVEALKMAARWQIESDETDAAISTLRSALDQEPQDTETMSLLADAHQRAGEFELAQDLLAMAAETSNYGPSESLRFAGELLRQDRLRPAEDVLINALRRSPDNEQLLRRLADVYLAQEDWNRLQDIENALRRAGTPSAVSAANTLRLQSLARTQGRDQAASFLEQLAEDDALGIGPRLSLLASRIETGDADGALGLAREIAAENDGDPRSGFLIANTLLGLGQYSDAEETLRDLVTQVPNFDQAWVQLIRSQSAQGKLEEARATVDEALADRPESPNLLWAKASFLEQSNDIDGAIEIYEGLYERNSNSPIIANNLASLLVTYRNDEESLERAFTIGRRLRGTEVPPFQDTYGWILFRRGDFEEAITYLQPAARSIPTDPIVQYHLAEAYNAAGQKEDALAQYRRVISIAGADDPRPQIAASLEAIAALEAEMEPAATTD